MARALLDSRGIKFNTDASIHLVTFDALVYYFYLNGKMQENLVRDFEDAKDEAAEILGQEKATEMIKDYFYEKKKRAKFTYEMGERVIQGKALTSLNRAIKFTEKIRAMINKI